VTRSVSRVTILEMESTYVNSRRVSLSVLLEASQSQTRAYRLQFTGSANEYFRIWIVNVFLTVITLGIYAAWAKVRTRRYFYAHTMLDGHPFEYHGDPRAILKGNLIVGLGIGVYYVVQQIRPEVSLALFAVGFCIFPWLVFQSLRFMASNSSYRNIRFRFHGTLGASYINYFLMPACVPFTLGLLAPYSAFKQRDYVFGNAAYGTTRASFSGQSGPFYSVYLAAFAVMFGVSIVAGIIIAVTLVPNLSRGNLTDPTAALTLVIPIYAALLLMFTLGQQYIYARLANYTWSNTTAPGLKFISTLSASDLIKLRFTNLLAIIFSLGLLSPWAKVRFTQYVLSKLSIVANTDLESFTADVNAEANALGDAATDFLNIDLGL
jgi:uncharacterized membrane protein YjgN (DUF898 family)